ncbi:putative E3 ubiquitin-protein ligase XBOS34 isoform X2 [Wolffia australiana]
MGAQVSKEELVYQQVLYANVRGIQRLRREGAGLEFIDKAGKTPLIVACMRPDLLPVAKVLIDLGANINAYRPGSHAGTPLHHAAKRGLDETVDVLLAHGANPLVANDDCHTPLDLARTKGHTKVVRLIENHICLFAGWLRELHGPGFLQVLAPQWASKKIWAAAVPCDTRNPLNPSRFELAIYPDLQAAQPKNVIKLWKADIVEPDSRQTDPVVTIVDNSSRTRFNFAAEREGDKDQISRFHDACRGISQTNHPGTPILPAGATAPPAAAPPPPVTEEMELAMAINASIQSAMAEGIPSQLLPHNSQPSSSSAVAATGWSTPPPNQTPDHSNFNGWGPPAPPSLDPPTVSLPSAPVVNGWDQIQYPRIDCSPVDLNLRAAVHKENNNNNKKKNQSDAGPEESSESGACVVCLDARVEGACVPCGHMAGCMACLQEIKGKSWGCPVCRTPIDQVIKLYAV